jgi:hypothetical protein
MGMFNSKKAFKQRIEDYKKESSSTIVLVRGTEKPLIGKLTMAGTDFIELSDGQMLVSVPYWAIDFIGASISPLMPNLNILRKQPDPAPVPKEISKLSRLEQIEEMLMEMKER